MRDETLRGWGSADPDDLAVVLGAALRAAGVEFRIRFRFAGVPWEGQWLTSFPEGDVANVPPPRRVRDDLAHVVSIDLESPTGTLIARLPCSPMPMTEDLARVMASAVQSACVLLEVPHASR